jgi:hypothetical protein
LFTDYRFNQASNLLRIGDGDLSLRLKPTFTIALTGPKNDANFKSGQK